MITAEERQLGRAKNSVMFHLERSLIVPKIYIDATWGGNHVDILAIDRAGVGDVHAVLMFLPEEDEAGTLNVAEYTDHVGHLLDQFSDVAAHYKYIAVASRFIQGFSGGLSTPPEWFQRNLAKFSYAFSSIEKSWSPDGLGRIGLLLISPSMGDEVEVKIEIKPERFRAKIAKLADEYVQQHEADWEIRA